MGIFMTRWQYSSLEEYQVAFVTGAQILNTLFGGVASLRYATHEKWQIQFNMGLQ